MSKQAGTVNWFNRTKGYGFIDPDDGGAQVFVHYSAILGDGYRNLYEGDRVTKGRGPQAQNVAQRGGVR